MTRLRRSYPPIGLGLASWVTAMGVLASTAAAVPPLQPNIARPLAPWLGYVFMIVLLAMVLAVSLLPSKRGHQD